MLDELLPANWFLALRTRGRALTWRQQPNSEFINRMKQRSMLHQKTLCLLDFFARRARRGILEIGAYVGGGTAVIAQALKESGSTVPFVTVEPGGAHEQHPDMPSSDILADLKTTLADVGVIERVKIAEGWSNVPSVVEIVQNTFGTRGIDMLVIDADGGVERDFNLYRNLLARSAVIVCDDYVCRDENVKEAPVRAWVDGATASKIVRGLGVFQWGTWFGVYQLDRPKGRWGS